jgi:plasmid replication initiation protein
MSNDLIDPDDDLEPRARYQTSTMPADEAQGYVSMSNRLARSAQSLKLAEKRLISACLAATDSVAKRQLALAVNSGWKVKVTAQEYARAFDLDLTTAYEQLQAASENLFERYVRYVGMSRTGRREDKKFRWVSAVTRVPGDGAVEVNFTPEIAPHLLGLRSHFTSYKLSQAEAFDSIYAWRLFELLRSWQSTGRYETSIEDFWDVMEAPPSCQKDFKALRTRIIEPSIKTLRAKANLEIEWTPIKAGSRRVCALEFRFCEHPQQTLPMGDTPGNSDSKALTCD